MFIKIKYLINYINTHTLNIKYIKTVFNVVLDNVYV